MKSLNLFEPRSRVCKKLNADSANLKLNARAGYLLVPTSITVTSAILASDTSIESFARPNRWYRRESAI